ncbi:alpha/beta hydrolase [Pseudoalteromonas sp. SCSIO 43088]|uniref:alpha/beta hydrolase n=1 Tax=Pseudoalteromonas sp. SCSIO 43088 TaxID=2822846 RepID=UPI00202B148D|nr:alpha/beta hydrolase [Pseudoalteromonas sp. SCSIO 43088]URQ85945.1 alpha/beta hydrolase [Pseudoalteromonas sp. SCSIO 43088]
MKKIKFKQIFAILSIVLASNAYAELGQIKQPQDSLAAVKSKGGVAASFMVEGHPIAANVYYPDAYQSTNQYQAIVVVAPQGGLKEQTAGIYAKKLAEKGFITIAFDHRTYGQSGGEPRHYENPHYKAEDIKGAVSYMSTLAGVDDRVSVLAICSGAGYGLMASSNDYRVQSFATVSGVFNFRERETGLNDIATSKPAQVKTFQQKMKASALARQKYFDTGIMDYTPLVPALTPQTSFFWRQGYDYYLTERGFINGWENKRSSHSFEARLSVNATTEFAKRLADLNTPFLAIAGDKAFTYPFSQRAITRALGNKELFTIEGATHFDLYDQDKYVNQAINKLDDFFKQK